MNWLITTLLSVLEMTDVHSRDPAIAAMKRARRGMLACVLGTVIFLVLAVVQLPDEAVSVPVRIAQELVSRLYLAGAVCSTVGLAWCTWRWWRARTRPDLYID